MELKDVANGIPGNTPGLVEAYFHQYDPCIAFLKPDTRVYFLAGVKTIPHSCSDKQPKPRELKMHKAVHNGYPKTGCANCNIIFIGEDK